MKKVLINLTTFLGQCTEAEHYYVSVSHYDQTEDYHSQRITRPITEREIQRNNDRFYCYEPGDMIDCFGSWKSAVDAAVLYIQDNNITGDVYVIGVPNNGILTLEQALHSGLDTRAKCSCCGKVFGKNEGLYNMPSGKLCVTCYAKKYRQS